MKSQFKSVPKMAVMLCGIIWFFMLLSSRVMFGSTLVVLLSLVLLLPHPLLSDDYIGY